MIRYGGIPVYGKFGRSEHWGSMLCCLRDHGLADELTTETSRQPVKIFKLRRGRALGREAREVLGGWCLLSSSINWLQTEPSEGQALVVDVGHRAGRLHRTSIFL